MYHKSLHKKEEKGQGLVEYALILVLVAIVVIAALMILGPIIGNVFSKVNSSLSGLGSGIPSGVGGIGGAASLPANCVEDQSMGVIIIRCTYTLENCGPGITVTCGPNDHPYCIDASHSYYSCN